MINLVLDDELNGVMQTKNI
jgi:hypothetical protein